MIGKAITIIMCAVVCAAQMPADCANIETICRAEPLVREHRYFRPRPIYKICREERFCGDEPEIIQSADFRSYPVIFSDEAQETSLPPVCQAPTIVTAPQERPVIHLPHSPIPRERVVSHKCTCTKTIIKPQIIKRVITVPKINRYLKRGFRPVVENVEYVAEPRGIPSSYVPKRFVAEPVEVAAERRTECLPPQFSQVSSIC